MFQPSSPAARCSRPAEPAWTAALQIGSIPRHVSYTHLQSKQVQFVSKKEAIDTTTPTGKFMLTVFGAVAELEREYILQRQREGIANAKENGVYKGRKPIVCAGFDSVFMLWRRREITAVEAQKRLGLSPSTFYRKVREYEKQIGKEEET